MEAGGLNSTNQDQDESISSYDNSKDKPDSNSILKKMFKISKILRTPPKGLKDEVFTNVILEQILEILRPSTEQESPSLFIRCSTFHIVRISEIKSVDMRRILMEWFWNNIWKAFNPDLGSNKLRGEEDEIVIVESSKIVKSLELVDTILKNVEPSTDFLLMMISSKMILPQAFSLLTFLKKDLEQSRKNIHSKNKDSKIQVINKEQNRKEEQSTQVRKEMSRILKDLIRIWFKLVDAKKGLEGVGLRENGLVRRLEKGGIGELAGEDKKEFEPEGARFWEAEVEDEMEMETYWSEERHGICIKFGR